MEEKTENRKVGPPVGNSNARKRPQDRKEPQVSFNLYTSSKEKEKWSYRATEAGLSLSRWAVLEIRKANK